MADENPVTLDDHFDILTPWDSLCSPAYTAQAMKPCFILYGTIFLTRISSSQPELDLKIVSQKIKQSKVSEFFKKIKND